MVTMVAWLLLLTAAWAAGAVAQGGGSAQGTASWPDRPPHEDFPRFARWLVHRCDWGVLSTASVEFGVPFGNVLSYSDGTPGNGTGRFLLIMAGEDSAVADLQANSSASFAVSEAQLPGACSGVDWEDPTCSRVTAVGTIGVLPPGVEADEAREMVYARHPVMRGWHAHVFRVYEFQPRVLRVLNYYGGWAFVSAREYFDADPVFGGDATEGAGAAA